MSAPLRPPGKSQTYRAVGIRAQLGRTGLTPAPRAPAWSDSGEGDAKSEIRKPWMNPSGTASSSKQAGSLIPPPSSENFCGSGDCAKKRVELHNTSRELVASNEERDGFKRRLGLQLAVHGGRTVLRRIDQHFNIEPTKKVGRKAMLEKEIADSKNKQKVAELLKASPDGFRVQVHELPSVISIAYITLNDYMHQFHPYFEAYLKSLHQCDTVVATLDIFSAQTDGRIRVSTAAQCRMVEIAAGLPKHVEETSEWDSTEVVPLAEWMSETKKTRN